MLQDVENNVQELSQAGHMESNAANESAINVQLPVKPHRPLQGILEAHRCGSRAQGFFLFGYFSARDDRTFNLFIQNGQAKVTLLCMHKTYGLQKARERMKIARQAKGKKP